MARKKRLMMKQIIDGYIKQLTEEKSLEYIQNKFKAKCKLSVQTIIIKEKHRAMQAKFQELLETAKHQVVS